MPGSSDLSGVYSGQSYRTSLAIFLDVHHHHNNINNTNIYMVSDILLKDNLSNCLIIIILPLSH